MLIASMGEELETRVERLVRYKIYCLNITASSVTKAAVCAILSVGLVHIKEPLLLIGKSSLCSMWRQQASFLTIRMVLNHMSDAI